MKEINQSDAEKNIKFLYATTKWKMASLDLGLKKMTEQDMSERKQVVMVFGQESHFHKNVKEIYIIQRGWVACAKLQNEKCKIQIFKEDEIFTIEPEVLHNLYLSKGFVIHTVKHGTPKKDNRVVNNEAKKLDKMVQGLDEEQILALAEKDKNENSTKEIYSKEYRRYA